MLGGPLNIQNKPGGPCQPNLDWPHDCDDPQETQEGEAQILVNTFEECLVNDSQVSDLQGGPPPLNLNGRPSGLRDLVNEGQSTLAPPLCPFPPASLVECVVGRGPHNSEVVHPSLDLNNQLVLPSSSSFWDVPLHIRKSRFNLTSGIASGGKGARIHGQGCRGDNRVQSRRCATIVGGQGKENKIVQIDVVQARQCQIPLGELQPNSRLIHFSRHNIAATISRINHTTEWISPASSK